MIMSTIHPIDFELYNHEGHPELFIDKDDQQLTLEVVNQGKSDLEFQSIDPTSKDAPYHFAFTFRPGTINASCLTKKTLQLAKESVEEWELTYNYEQNKPVILRFKVKSTPQVWKQRERCFIKLEKLGASTQQGTHATRVKLEVNQIRLRNAQKSLPTITRQSHLKLINHQGKENIPLEAVVVGDAAVLNDGVTSNALTIRLINTAKYDPVNPEANLLQFKNNDLDHTKRSRLVFSFPAGEPDDVLALATGDQLRTMTVEQPTGWEKEKNAAGEWVFYPADNFVLYPKEHPTLNEDNSKSNWVEVAFKGLITKGITGQAQLQVNYENVRGYWDGGRDIIIEKRLIQYQKIDQKPVTLTQSSIGIGTENPSSTLHVERRHDQGEQSIFSAIGNNKTTLAILKNKGSGTVLYVEQGGKGAAACFDKGTVTIENVRGSNHALIVEGKTHYDTVLLENEGSGKTLNVVQNGNGPAASFKGGPVTIQGVSGQVSALHIDVETKVTHPPGSPYDIIDGGEALKVTQKGSGRCALFEGGEVIIKNSIGGESKGLSVNTKGSTAIYANNEGSGYCGYFVGWSVFQGAVRIGDYTGQNGLLEINGSMEWSTLDGYGYLNKNGRSRRYDNHRKTSYQSCSIYANRTIAASEFNAHSDIRIKEVLRTSESFEDLQVLLQVQVTDYEYIDVITAGNNPQKKLIGQQVAQVFPQAVSFRTQVVPDCMQKVHAENGRIPLVGHDFNKGDRLKLIFPDNSSKIHEVLEVEADCLQVDENVHGEVFLYGREVDDFHVVDYDAISMLNVSATQALHQKIEQQEKTIHEQEGRITKLEDTVQLLLTKIEQLAS